MDSQHKHELRESDLANFIGAVKKFWGRYQMHVLGAAVVIAAIVLVVRWRNAAAQAEHEQTWFALNTKVEASDLVELARTAEDESVRLAASLRAAHALLTRATVPPQGDEEAPLTDQQKQDLLTEAEGLYKLVANRGGHGLMVFNARFGLAAIAENRRQWDAAAKLYDEVAAAARAEKGFEWFAHQAEARKASLPLIQIEPIWGQEKAADAATPGGENQTGPEKTADDTSGDKTGDDKTGPESDKPSSETDNPAPKPADDGAKDDSAKDAGAKDAAPKPSDSAKPADDGAAGDNPSP